MATALVTGASSGIGLAFATELARRGDDLVLVARDTARLDEVASQLRDHYGRRVSTLPADLGVRENVQRVADRLADQQQPVDLLVNNAGFADHDSLLADDLWPHERAVDVMITAILVLAGTAARTMKARGQGGIINLGSANAFLYADNYSAIKAWVVAYTEALAAELDGTGVQACVSCPGWVKTAFHERAGLARPHVPSWAFTPAPVVARTALADLAAGRVISVPTTKWKVAVTALHYLPRPVVRRISKAIAGGHKEAS